ncbi:MAG: FAD-dependent oxidoreductase [Desulfosarcinaceae bacterium]|nr:FAD-dependent oxidoreductase [Desulfosarcinaceae bacterium]
MGKHLVLIGGGHAHMVTLAHMNEIVAQGHRVTVVGPSAHHYYSGMGPGMLGGTYTPDEIRFATQHVVEKQGGQFICDSVTVIDAANRRLELAEGDALTYDVLSVNAGSYVPRNLVAEDTERIVSVKPIEKLMDARQALRLALKTRSEKIVIVGGGPSAAEIGGNIWQLAQEEGLHTPHITILAGNRFMADFPEAIRRRAMNTLTRRGILVLESGYAKIIRADGVTLADGGHHPADRVFLALGVRPSDLFAASNLPIGPDGGLRVNAYLQCTEHPEIFGGGDCIHYTPSPLDKVGVFAVRQNPILFQNLLASLNNDSLTPFDPGGSYLLIFNMGGGIGILHKAGITLGGRLAFHFKDWIDRRFMRRFQAIEH